jgi:hypothetical protein
LVERIPVLKPCSAILYILIGYAVGKNIDIQRRCKEKKKRKKKKKGEKEREVRKATGIVDAKRYALFFLSTSYMDGFFWTDEMAGVRDFLGLYVRVFYGSTLPHFFPLVPSHPEDAEDIIVVCDIRLLLLFIA